MAAEGQPSMVYHSNGGCCLGGGTSQEGHGGCGGLGGGGQPLLSFSLTGPWKPPQIDNPDYKGEWVHPQIDNPEYEPDDTLYKFDDFGIIGFDLWQVQSSNVP